MGKIGISGHCGFSGGAGDNPVLHRGLSGNPHDGIAVKAITAEKKRGRPATAKPDRNESEVEVQRMMQAGEQSPERVVNACLDAVVKGNGSAWIRRIIAVGPEADPALAATPLGILEARQVIPLELRAAGDTYRSLYSRASNLGRWIGLGGFGGECDEKTAERIRGQFMGLAGHLRIMGNNVIEQVHNVAVFQLMPVWLMFALHNPHKHVWKVVKHHPDCIDLYTGLRELDKLMGRR